jgi:hypothetical protein
MGTRSPLLMSSFRRHSPVERIDVELYRSKSPAEFVQALAFCLPCQWYDRELVDDAVCVPSLPSTPSFVYRFLSGYMFTCAISWGNRKTKLNFLSAFSEAQRNCFICCYIELIKISPASGDPAGFK